MPTMLETSLADLRLGERVAEAGERAGRRVPHLPERRAGGRAGPNCLAPTAKPKPISMPLRLRVVAGVDGQRATSCPLRRTVSAHRRGRAAAVRRASRAAVAVDPCARRCNGRPSPRCRRPRRSGRPACSTPAAGCAAFDRQHGGARARPSATDGSRFSSTIEPLRTYAAQQHAPEQHERDQRGSPRARRGSRRSASRAAACSRRARRPAGRASPARSGSCR